MGSCTTLLPIVTVTLNGLGKMTKPWKRLIGSLITTLSFTLPVAFMVFYVYFHVSATFDVRYRHMFCLFFGNKKMVGRVLVLFVTRTKM